MPRYTDKQIEEALIACKGMVYVAANRLGCSPNTIKDRLVKSPKLIEAMETAKGLTADTTELKLFAAIQNGESWAIQFYLKTQCKNRGYVERTENYNIDVSELSDSDLEAIASGKSAGRTRAQTTTEGEFIN